MKHRIRLLAAVLVTIAVPAVAQRPVAPITQAEIAASGQVNLFDAVNTLRPGWIALLGDTLSASGFDPLLVYVDRRHLGNASALRTIDPASVAAVHLRSPNYVRDIDPRYPRYEFAGALFVSTVAPPEVGVRKQRASLSVYAVAPLQSLPARVRDGLAREGFTDELVTLQGLRFRMDPQGRDLTPGIGANARLPVTPRLSAEVLAEHVFEAWIGRFDRDARGVGATFAWTDAALMGSFQGGFGRLAVGPVLRRAEWTWVEGLCGCGSPESSSSTGYGLGATLNTTPLLPRRGMLDVRVSLRHFLSHELPAYGPRPALDVSGTEFSFALGLGVHR